jgi:hypothetical protein
MKLRLGFKVYPPDWCNSLYYKPVPVLDVNILMIRENLSLMPLALLC